MKFKLLLVSFIVILITGCASGYNARGSWWNIFNEQGYSSKVLDDGSYLVKFDGNGYTSSKKASDFALLRASEICLEQGKSFVEILDLNDDRSTMNVSGYYITYAKASHHVKFHEKKPKTVNQVVDAKYLRALLRKQYELDEQK